MRNRQVATGNRSRYEKRARLDPVRNHGMLRPPQFLHAANPQRRTSIPGNLRSHLPQHHNEVRHFRLPRRVFQHGLALRERRRHQNIFRPGHRNLLKHDVRALQPPAFWRARLDVPVRSDNLRAHLLQRLQVQIHRPRPDRASPRQRYSRHSHSRHQRPQRQDRRPHRLHQFVRRLRMVQTRRFDYVIARRHLRHGNLRVHERQQLAHGDQVAHLRDVVQRHRFRRQQRRRHHRQRRVLRPADRHRPPQRLPALDQKFIHPASRVLALVAATLCRHLSSSVSSLAASLFSVSSVLILSSHSPIAFLSSPLAAFNFFLASDAPTPNFNITSATLMSCPAARRACSAADTFFPLASTKIRRARSASFSFVSIMSIIKFSYTCPRRAITAVLSMFNTIFCDVPAFNRVDPVSTSGPTSGAITILASRAAAIRRLDVTATVNAPRARANFIAVTTYGVVPLAVTPTTMSLRVNFLSRNSRSAFRMESSAPSTAPVTARRPPAINASTTFGETPNVGGHSAASSTAIRPLDPAPKYINRPPFRIPLTIASTARAIAVNSRPTTAATLRSSRFINRTISRAVMRSRFLDAAFLCSVNRCSVSWRSCTRFLAGDGIAALYLCAGACCEPAVPWAHP